MALVTPANIIRHIAPTELAQLADRGDAAPVSGALLAATIAEGDRSEWTADEQAAADEALANIEAACELVTGLIESHLDSYALPLVSVPSSITLCGVDLVRHRLQVGRQAGQVTEATQKQHDFWMKWLGKVGSGETQLGLTPAAGATPPKDVVRFEATGRTFSADTLGDY